MSPPADTRVAYARGFPRVSGDEPLDALLRANPAAFSPRERG